MNIFQRALSLHRNSGLDHLPLLLFNHPWNLCRLVLAVGPRTRCSLIFPTFIPDITFGRCKLLPSILATNISQDPPWKRFSLRGSKARLLSFCWGGQFSQLSVKKTRSGDWFSILRRSDLVGEGRPASYKVKALRVTPAMLRSCWGINQGEVTHGKVSLKYFLCLI